MLIHFCGQCGVRIAEADISSGSVKPDQEERFICPACAAPPRAPKTPSKRVRASSERRARLAPAARKHLKPAPDRATTRPKPATGGSANLLLPIIGVAIVVALLAVAVLVFRGASETSPVKTDRSTQSTDEGKKAAGHEASPPPAQTKTGTDAKAPVSNPPGKKEVAPPSIANALIAHWTFDESEGKTASDTAGANEATLKGKTHFVAGRVGRGAVRFEGGQDHVDLGVDPSLNFGRGAPFTIACWFRTTVACAMLISFRNTNHDSTDLDIAIGNHGGAKKPGCLMAIVRQDGVKDGHSSVVGRKANDGAWHHVTLTRNAKGTVRLFLDGRFQGMQTSAGSGGAITTNLRTCGLERMWIRTPKSPDETGQGLKGEMDDLRVYRRALTDDQVRELVQAAGEKR